jgi:uncharacterized protein (TIGR02284 family)
MTHSEELTDTLNDLVLINNDRIEGYQKAIESLEAQDSDLKMLFAKLISNSRNHIEVLSDMITSLGGKVEDGTTTSGKIFRTWMSIKTVFMVNDRASTLDSCESGEEAALKAYDMAFGEDVAMSTDMRQILMDQRVSIKGDHNQIKKLRDLHQNLA